MTPNKDETGDAVNQAKVTDGDEIDFYVYQDTSTWSDNYIWLEDANGSKLDGQTVTAGTTLELYVKGYSPFSYGMKEDSVIREHASGIASAALQLVDMTSGSCTAVGAVSDESGKISVQIPKDWQGTYWLTAQGTKTIMALAKVQVDAAPVSDAINLSSLEIAIGGNTEDSKNVQTFTPAFDGKVTDYSTDILDYQGDRNQRFVWVKAFAPEGVTMTAKCEDSKSATLANGEWTMLYTEKTEGNWWDPQIVQVRSLQPNKFNKLTITVSKEGETDKTYTVELPMNPDISKKSLAWKTNLSEAIYYTQNAENAALSVEAEYKNRPLKNEDVITYQWYKNTENSTEGATPVDGATDTVYKPDVSATGTTYYYAVASCADVDSITSQIIAVTVTDKKAPESISIQCDYPYTILDTWGSALGGKDYVAKPGDKLQLKAVDENGEETPISWKKSTLNGNKIDEATGQYEVVNTSNANIKAVSLYDSSIVSEEKVIKIEDYTISQYNKAPSVTLSTDGQTIQSISTIGGVAGYTIWNYKMSDDKIAVLTSDPDQKAKELRFEARRPGTIEASFDLDLDGDGVSDGNGQTDSATLTIKGIAVEDADGKLTKTYLETSTANPNPTMQLHALSSTENAAFTWSSTDDTVATVNEDGVVTAQGVGTVIISAKDGTYTGGIKLVVTNADKPYFEQLNFASGWGPNGIDGWTTTTFKPDTLNYTGIKIRAASKNSLTLDKTTEYNAEHDLAVATYTDENGEKQEIEINSGAQTILPGIPFETNTITITLTDRTDNSKQTVYTFEVTRPRDQTKTIAQNGITFLQKTANYGKICMTGKKKAPCMWPMKMEALVSILVSLHQDIIIVPMP
ncbi:MAG: Ig-like domain-containing protein [Lachnospiraceae bacterium]